MIHIILFMKLLLYTIPSLLSYVSMVNILCSESSFRVKQFQNNLMYII